MLYTYVKVTTVFDRISEKPYECSKVKYTCNTCVKCAHICYTCGTCEHIFHNLDMHYARFAIKATVFTSPYIYKNFVASIGNLVCSDLFFFSE